MNGALAGVAVVHYGEPDPTIRCVRSVLDDRSKCDRRLVIVDNSGNLDGRDFTPGVRLVQRQDNPGFGTAINIGASLLDADRSCTFYVVLNNDAVLISGYLDAAARALEVGVGAVGGPIHDDEDNGPLWFAGGWIDFVTGTVRQERSRVLARRRRDVGYIPATAMAISCAAWRDVGGFDERYFLYNEDLDLCLRLRRRGWRLRFEPEMECVHSLGGTTGSGQRSPLYLENLTATRFLPFQSRAYRIYLGGLHSVYNFVRVLTLAARHTSHSGPYVRAVTRGHMHALKSIFR